MNIRYKRVAVLEKVSFVPLRCMYLIRCLMLVELYAKNMSQSPQFRDVARDILRGSSPPDSVPKSKFYKSPSSIAMYDDVVATAHVGNVRQCDDKIARGGADDCKYRCTPACAGSARPASLETTTKATAGPSSACGIFQYD